MLATPPFAARGGRLPPSADPLDDPSWDAKVATLPGATFFHGADWARVLHHTYGYRPRYLAVETEGALDGVLPLMEVDSWLTGRRGVSLPFTDHCAPLGRDADVVARLERSATALAASQRWRHWELRGGLPSRTASLAQSFHGHTIDLAHSGAELFARCDSAVRRAVRKARNGPLTISFSHDLDAMHAFYRLLCGTRQRHGLPPQPFRFFQQIQRCILQPRHGCIVLARAHGLPVAGAVFFHFGRSAVFKFGASDEHFQHLRPNNLVMWRAIEWHASSGFTSLDLGRTSLHQEGLRRFKLGWGAREYSIAYARYDCRTAAFVTVPDHASGWLHRWFRFVPTALARVIGSAVYKHAA